MAYPFWPLVENDGMRLLLMSCVLLVTACGGSSPLLVRPEIDASLLQPCVDPMLAPENASDNELAAERLRFGKAYLDCKARHETLAGRVKDTSSPPETKKKGWFW